MVFANAWCFLSCHRVTRKDRVGLCGNAETHDIRASVVGTGLLMIDASRRMSGTERLDSRTYPNLSSGSKTPKIREEYPSPAGRELEALVLSLNSLMPLELSMLY